MKRKKLLLVFIITVLVLISALFIWKVPYVYNRDRIEELAEKYYLHGLDDVESVKTNIWVSDFCGFTAGETEIEEIYDKLGKPHASSGSGFVWDVYFTKDQHAVYVYWQDKVLSIYKLNLKTGKAKDITSVDGWSVNG